MTPLDIQRWSREVAEDPGAPSFVALARSYRRQGRREAALHVSLEGLERNPENVDAHGVLAMLYADVGDRQRAGDEWEIMLRLDPGNFQASRGLGFLALERGDLGGAARHLEAAAAVRPDDPTVAQALEVLARRSAGGGDDGPGGDGTRAANRAEPADAAEPADGAKAPGRQPVHLFDSLAGDAPFIGAVLVDAQGLVVAGSMPGEGGRGETLGGLLNPAVVEARRAVELLGLGAWQGLILDCHDAAVHVAPANGDAVVLTVAEREAPAGWLVRVAGRARDLAVGFLEGRP